MSHYEAGRVVDGEQVATNPGVLVTLAGAALSEVFSAAAEVDGLSLLPRQVKYRITVWADA